MVIILHFADDMDIRRDVIERALEDLLAKQTLSEKDEEDVVCL